MLTAKIISTKIDGGVFWIVAEIFQDGVSLGEVTVTDVRDINQARTALRKQANLLLEVRPGLELTL